jgi:hypothetical protein
MANEPVNGTTHDHVWNNCQRKCDDHRLAQIYRLENAYFIDDVEYCGDEKDFPYSTPAFAQSLSPMWSISEDGNEIRWPPRLSVPHTSDDPKERGNRRLYEEAKRHWAAQAAEQLFPAMGEERFQTSLLRVTTSCLPMSPEPRHGWDLRPRFGTQSSDSTHRNERSELKVAEGLIAYSP